MTRSEQVRSNSPITPPRGTRLCVCGLPFIARFWQNIDFGASEKGDQRDDHDREDNAHHRRPESQAALISVLGQQVTDGRSQWTSDNISDPKCKYSIEFQAEVRGGHYGDHDAEQHSRLRIPQVHLFGNQVSCRRSQ